MKARMTRATVAIRRLTLSAMLVALGTVMLLLGALLDVLDLSAVALAALATLLARRELPLGYALGVFGATALLAFLLLPNPSPALLYVLFGGWYPLLRPCLSARRRLLFLLVKLVLFAAATTGYLLLSVLVLGMPAEVWWMNVAIYVVGGLAFALYDVLLGRLLLLYEWRLRPRIEPYLS